MRSHSPILVLASLLSSSLLFAEPKGVAVGPAAKPEPSAALECRLAGQASLGLDVPLVDRKGQGLARFGGVPVPLSIYEWPEQASGRLLVTTGGLGRLSLEGYIDARALPLYVKNDVAVVPGYVALAKGARVEFSGTQGQQLRVTHRAVSPLAEAFTVTVPCDALALEAPKSELAKIPGHARGYVMKTQAAPLFDASGASANPVATLHLAPNAAGVLFFGDRREGDFIHVLYQHDVRIDAWMSLKDLELLPKGELLDQRAHKTDTAQASRLSVMTDGKVYRAERELPLYGKADPKLPPIGTVPKDTELYVLDVVVGWANVLPKQLDVVPLSERRFWVRASELGI